MGNKSGNGEKAQARAFKKDLKDEQRALSRDDTFLRSLGVPETEIVSYRVLEPRILLDAAAADTADMVLDHAEEPLGENYFHNDMISPVSVDASQPYVPLFEATNTPTPENLTNDISQIVFIDADVESIDDLIADINPQYEIVILNGSLDGVEQIAEHLSSYSDIEAVHILSHGDSGALSLGTGLLTLESIEGRYADDLAVIQQSLTESADILIYGCDFAQGELGANAVTALAKATGADIAASKDLTGSTALGGDWDLEVQFGQVEAVALSPLAWAHTLDLTITDIGAGGTGITGAPVDALAAQIFGDGVTINSASYTGGAQQAATFVTGAGTSFGNDILTFEDGAIFSSGTASSVGGPNNSGSFSVNAPGADGDPDFNALSGGGTFDAAFLEVSFTPDIPPGASAGDVGQMTVEIVFGSDEYNEFVYGSVNDTLAVIINGVNQAAVANGLAIGIDTINDAANFNPASGSPANDPNPEHTGTGFESANPSLYVNNDTGAFDTQMDGFTITIPVTFEVIVGQVNTMKIGIADTGDALYDSWMFVKADSAQTVIVAYNDSVSTAADTPVNIDVTTNDYDLQGDPLTVTHILGQPVTLGDTITLSSGVDVTLELDGTLTVAGDGANAVNDAFTYSITDGNGGSSTAFVDVNITEPNYPPDAVDDAFAIDEATPLSDNVISNISPSGPSGDDTDPNGDVISVVEINGGTFTSGTQFALPSGALLTMNTDGSFNYDPNGQFDGLAVTDSATDSFTYTVTDPDGAQDTAVVTINISGLNDAPIINSPISDQTFEDAETVSLMPSISDPNSDTLTYSATGLPAGLSINSSTGEISGTIDNSASTGGDDPVNAPGVYTVTITADDGNGGTVDDVVVFTITNPAPQVDTPMADQNFEDAEIVSVTPAISDPDNDTLTYSTAGLPAGLSINSTTGEISGTIDNSASTGGDDPVNAPGVYTVTVTADDGEGGTVEEEVTFTITNPPPLAQDDDVTTNEDTVLNANVLFDNGNGADADPDGDDLTVTLVDGSAGNVNTPAAGSGGGEFTINADGTFSFDPGSDFQDLAAGETRTSSITYTISDGEGGSSQANVEVTVSGVNDGPVIIDPDDPFPDPNDPPIPGDPNNVIADISGSDLVPITPISASSFFYDVEGDPIEFSLDPGTTPPWLSINPTTGEITGTPPSNASQGGPGSDGVYTITIIGTDDDNLNVSTTVTITVANQAPDTSGLRDDVEVAGNQYELPTGLAFSDPDGDVLSFSATGLPSGLSIDPTTGLISGMVDPNAVLDAPNGDGIYSVLVTADDGEGGTISAPFTLTITDPVAPPADPPNVPETQGPLNNPEDPTDPDTDRFTSLDDYTGLFDLNHPVTEALYEISPLAVGISIDVEELPVTQMSNWIDRTREQLAGSDEPRFYEGNDQTIRVHGGEIIVRAMGWQDIIFVELISVSADMTWQVEGAHDLGDPDWIEQYGQNLLAVQLPADLNSSQITISGDDGAGFRVQLQIEVGSLQTMEKVTSVTIVSQNMSFDRQLQTLSNKSSVELRSLFPTS